MLRANASGDLSNKPIIIRLCGWVQKTDRLALREIAYQLTQQTGSAFLTGDDEDEGDENEDEDDQCTSAQTNTAGNDDGDGDDDEENPFLVSNKPSKSLRALAAERDQHIPTALPPAAHLPALIGILPTLARPTIVVLDAFDLFALHPRQSLLYCLLDTVQSCRAGGSGNGGDGASGTTTTTTNANATAAVEPGHVGAANKGLAVVGMTSRIDANTMLEKRVKSRFSGRIFRTAPPGRLREWVRIVKAVLLADAYTPPPPPPQLVVENDEMGVVGGGKTPRRTTTTKIKAVAAVAAASAAKKGVKGRGKEAAAVIQPPAAVVPPEWKEWNALWRLAVRQFVEDDAVQGQLHESHALTKDVRLLIRLLVRFFFFCLSSCPAPLLRRIRMLIEEGAGVFRTHIDCSGGEIGSCGDAISEWRAGFWGGCDAKE